MPEEGSKCMAYISCTQVFRITINERNVITISRTFHQNLIDQSQFIKALKDVRLVDLFFILFISIQNENTTGVLVFVLLDVGARFVYGK